MSFNGTKPKEISAGLIRQLIEQYLETIGIDRQVKLPWKDSELIPIELYQEGEVKVIRHK